MIADPPIVFCDEPTTGLDGYNALRIIEILNDLAKMAKIVIISLHQPSSDIIRYLNHILLLSNGRVVIQGSTKKITGFFEGYKLRNKIYNLFNILCYHYRLNFQCPESYNIAEFYINQISIRPGHETECKRKINILRSHFLATESNDINTTVVPSVPPNYKKE